jgi:UDP-N-acetylmuramoyl-tripeptide--D-alanyl-D-alanine ligase
VGVVTNVHPVHLERARTIERIAQAKAELPAHLPPAPEGWAVLNYDDERVRAMAAQTRARVLTYGRGTGADVRADDVENHGLRALHAAPRQAHDRCACRYWASTTCTRAGRIRGGLPKG